MNLAGAVTLSKQLRDARVALAKWRVVSATLFILLVISLAGCKQAGMHWLDTVPKQSCQKDGSC